MKWIRSDQGHILNLPNGIVIASSNTHCFIPNINWCAKNEQWTPSPISADKHLVLSDHSIELMNPKEGE